MLEVFFYNNLKFKKMKKFIYLVLLLLAQCSFAQLVELDMKYYKTFFDTILKQPIYAQYTTQYNDYNIRYGRSSTTVNNQIKRNKQAQKKDFKNDTIFDKGHLVPIIDFGFSKEAIKKVDVFTNVVAQNYILNRGIWRDLEVYINYLHQYMGYNVEVFIYVEYSGRKLGKLNIPQTFYKMIHYKDYWLAWQFDNFNLGSLILNDHEINAEIVKQKINKLGFHKIN